MAARNLAAIAADAVAEALYHENQRLAAQEIYDHFSGLERYVILPAMCQSGKTGTFNRVARRMLQSGKVDKVFIICGTADKNLREQAMQDAARLNPEFCLIEPDPVPARAREGLHRVRPESQIQVVFHQDLKHVALPRSRVLIILDESHLAQNTKMKVMDFFHKNGYDLCGTCPRMVAQDQYILSVSATAYSELSDHYHKVVPGRTKVVVALQPGAGYIGVREHMEAGRIHPTFSVEDEGDWERLEDLVLEKGNKFNIFRCHAKRGDREGTLDLIERYARAAGIRVLYYNSTQKTVAITREEQNALINTAYEAEKKLRPRMTPREQIDLLTRLTREFPCLEVAPTQPTIVLIKGTLRCGKVVPKKHIGIVWEDSHDPDTDVIIQSLLGRMCGYEFSAQKPEIYCARPLLEHAQALLDQNELERHVMMPVLLPRYARNLLAGRVARGPREGERNPCVPLRITAAEMRAWRITEQRVAPRSDAEKRAEVDRLINSEFPWDSTLSEEQSAEILENLPRESTHARSTNNEQLHGTHNEFFRHVAIHAEIGTLPTHRVSEDPLVTGLYVEIDLGANAKRGDVLLFFNTVARLPREEETQRVAIEARFPKTNGKEMYRFPCPEEYLGEETVMGTGLYLKRDVETNPEKLRELFTIILDAERRGFASNRTFTTKTGAFLQIHREAYNFVSRTDNDFIRILEDLAAEFSVRFLLHGVVNGGAGAPHAMLLKKITWVPVN
jgi:hypothetical protein